MSARHGAFQSMFDGALPPDRATAHVPRHPPRGRGHLGDGPRPGPHQRHERPPRRCGHDLHRRRGRRRGRRPAVAARPGPSAPRSATCGPRSTGPSRSRRRCCTTTPASPSSAPRCSTPRARSSSAPTSTSGSRALAPRWAPWSTAGVTPGLLTVDDLRAEVAAGAVDTVICRVPRPVRAPHGQAARRRLLPEDPDGGTHACDYLFTVDMEMEPVDGYDFASWAQGYGDVHLVPDLSTLRRCSWLDRTALVLCDADLGPDPVRGRSPQHPRRPGPAGRRARVHGQGGQRARVLPLPRHLRRRRRSRPPGPAPRRLVHRGLPPPAGQPDRGPERPVPPAPRRLRHPGRVHQGRVGTGPARAQHRLLRRRRDGRPPRPAQARLQGDRRRARRVPHVHGQARRRRGRLVLAPPPLAVAPRRQRVRQRRDLPALPRRVDGPGRRADGVLGADGQQLQALPGPVVGPHGAGVVARQPHRRVPDRGARARPSGSSAGSPAPT